MKSIVLAFVLLASAVARAAPGCRNLAATAMTFPVYNVYVAGPTDGTSTVSYSCPRALTPSIDLSAGNGGSFSPRLMSSGSDTLAYNVFVDLQRMQVWDATPVPVPSGHGQSVTLYGRIFAQQDVSVGTYSDTLTVTINF